MTPKLSFKVPNLVEKLWIHEMPGAKSSSGAVANPAHYQSPQRLECVVESRINEASECACAHPDNPLEDQARTNLRAFALDFQLEPEVVDKLGRDRKLMKLFGFGGREREWDNTGFICELHLEFARALLRAGEIDVAIKTIGKSTWRIYVYRGLILETEGFEALLSPEQLRDFFTHALAGSDAYRHLRQICSRRPELLQCLEEVAQRRSM